METILFLIIAGILSTIFGKAKGKSKGITKTGFDDFRTKIQKQMVNIPRKTGQISTGQPVKKENPMQRKVEKENPILSTKQPIPTESKKLKIEAEDISLESPDEKTIINGIIWSEILGEPRAKKPYFRKNY